MRSPRVNWRNLAAMGGLSVILAGCALGIQPGDKSPSVSYTVPRNYQTVYLRAQNQATECLRGKSEYDVVGKVDPAMQSGSVEVREPLSGAVVARTTLKAVDAQHTQVTHTVWGHELWDARALAAMRESILMDSSVCTVYK
ncbi:MAG TPA: hypothetical protein VNT00_15495 [Eoetvoesiella sp.]|nr:hypothetical protein [Eoetvoesiella sp.]